MQPAQQQTLSLSDNSSAPFSWTITQGGGSLSSPDGLTTVYTSPTSNANCMNNARVRVTDRCGRKAYLYICTNTDTPGVDAFRSKNVHCWQNHAGPDSFEGNPTFGPQNWAVFDRYYDCNNLYTRTGAHAFVWSNVGWDIYPHFCETYMSAGTGVNDLRTPAMKANGCCPCGLV
jgi:hypothetical protein